MIIKEIIKDDYMYLYDLYCIDKTKIDTKQYSDKYFALYNTANEPLATCGIHFQKKNICQLNGLLSVKRGSGRALALRLEYFLTKHYDVEHIRLNCIGTKLYEYYKKIGYNQYLKYNIYREMIKDL